MAVVDDIRINGQQTSLGTVMIAGLHPVISWDFTEDAAAPSQTQFELQVANNNTDLGTNDFVGNSINVEIVSTGNVYEVLEHVLSRGVTYYGQIRVTDVDGDLTIWETFSFTTNRLPFVTNHKLTPGSPTLADDIELNYTFMDPDGHEQAGTKIRWFRNNIYYPNNDDLCTLSASETTSSDSWHARIIPSDGLEFGTPVDTAAVTVVTESSESSTISNIKILPADANVDDLLQVTFDLVETEYVVVTGTVEIEWYINGVLVPNSNKQIIRLDLDPGDTVYVIIKLTEGTALLAQAQSETIVIEDVRWYAFDLMINGLVNPVNITDLTANLEWKTHKTTSVPNELPTYLQVKVTRSPSLSQPLYNSGLVTYTKDTFKIPSGVLSRGQSYYVHLAVSDDTEIDNSQFISTFVSTAGSSWSDSVNNSKGWTIEFKLQVDSDNMGVLIHDGSHFISIRFAQTSITVLSEVIKVYDLPQTEPPLSTSRTFRIIGKGTDLRVYMNNVVVMDIIGEITNQSQLKVLQYGDVDGKNLNSGIFKFFRYSTAGAYGFGDPLPNENTFVFHEVGQIDGGSIDYVFEDVLAWTPDDTSKGSKLIQFNDNAATVRLPTVPTNYSPITTIYVDKDRNKYIGTANGVNVVYGDRHDFDYEFLTDETNVTITTKDFDRITTVSASTLPNAEPDVRAGWFTLDTTYRAVGEPDPTTQFITNDPYDPYVAGIRANAILYYTQRAPGHAWFDNVDNEKGWQVRFGFDLEKIEADDFVEKNLQHDGFGIYVNDGKYQEIVYFYDDRIRLFYANVFVPIVNTRNRDFVIVGKGKNIDIYQKLQSAPIGAFQHLVQGAGLFTTPSTIAANSTKPKVTFDEAGVYHAVWHDDGNKRSQILYSKNDGSGWSNPELVTETTQFNLRNPCVDVDSQGRPWVVYEDTSWGQSEISISVKDGAGWNPRVRLTNAKSNKGRPDIKVDIFDDVHVVWEDDRNGHWEILWAKWDNNTQAWTASNHFGNDMVVASNDSNDPYQSVVDFRNPQLSMLHPNLLLVFEAHLIDQNESLIYFSYYDLENDQWTSSGVSQFDTDGEFLGTSSSTLISPINRNCVNPSVAAQPNTKSIVFAWEDQTEPISQIWGAAYSTVFVEQEEAQQLTVQLSDCKNPSVGFTSAEATIAFEKDNEILAFYYDTATLSFVSSALGGSDITISINASKNASHPDLPEYIPTKVTHIVYDFTSDRNEDDLASTEFPDFRYIGDATITQSGGIATNADTMISNVDTKEFAFGDFSENVGLLAHWKDVQMYFGYDARPHSILKLNQKTVLDWPDNRITDIFVDVFGNIIVGTYKGLVYHNVFTGQMTLVEGHIDDQECQDPPTNCILIDKLVTAVAWGKNGIWYVGTTEGAFVSTTAGRLWASLAGIADVVNDIAVNARGEAVIATDNGITITDSSQVIATINVVANEPPGTETKVRAVAIDEKDIIWAGLDNGLYRIENFTEIQKFGRQQGMRSSYVTDIAIINKHLRYVGTATGVERMHGTRFTNFNVNTHAILNDNISQIEWQEDTNSLWVASLYALHEIVFRDPEHEIIQDEIEQYNTFDLSTKESYDKDLYFVLDIDAIQPDPENPLTITDESTSVFINKNLIDFGFTVENGEVIQFVTDMLARDQVEIEVSNKFLEQHEFIQRDIEKKIIGERRTVITKIDRTKGSTESQLLYLAGGDRKAILLDTGDTILPFTTILLDREMPIGCLELLETVTKTVLRFRILAFDEQSGIAGYMLSNYENFTSDGETPLDFSALPVDGIVTHDIGAGLNNIITSLTFPTTVEIGALNFDVGTGGQLGLWADPDEEGTLNLYAATSAPIVMFRYDPIEDKWNPVVSVEPTEPNREVTTIKSFANVMYLTTGEPGGVGKIYKTADGVIFDLVGGVTGSYARGIAFGPEGSVFFGSSDGKVYSLKDGVLQVKYQNIGGEIYALDVFENLMVVATGTQGRIYLIDLETDDNLIIFDGNDTFINDVHIKDKQEEDLQKAILYAASGDMTTIYRAKLSDLDFVKSYSSFGKDIYRLKQVDKCTVTDIISGSPPCSSGEQVEIAAVGDTLFKHTEPAWEFIYRHDEEILDFVQFESNGVDGIWVISKSKVTKRTNQLSTKNVFLRLKDKAGNLSASPDLTEYCPSEEQSICCNYAYSINIADLKNFANEGRIIDVDEYGSIIFTYDSPTDRNFYSGDQIDQEVGIYDSEVFNGSNELVSWKTISWDSTEPSGTSVNVQIRSASTEDGST